MWIHSFADKIHVDCFVAKKCKSWIRSHEHIRKFRRIAECQHPEGKPFRKNYAGIGYKYDAKRDAFIPPQPFPSWTLNEDACLWDPPVPIPIDGQFYNWDEATASWVVNE
jgi:hypothetical protein